MLHSVSGKRPSFLFFPGVLVNQDEGVREEVRLSVMEKGFALVDEGLKKESDIL